MSSVNYAKLIKFLSEDLMLPAASIEVAQKTSEKAQGPLPMVLWQYGLVTLEQLDRIYDWMETA
ncbi:MAG: DUF2949 domain-containing protein [Kaiparowitsia implicata GSE-PSE-MK54-09C]|jgi:hypothetical protein|nr:DUF2949 domain-containing protein [Kaiparowitsia implicata GSE-PSE-MK54-09C]